MSTLSTNDMKPGVKVLFDGDPYAILENEYVKPGKGQAFTRVKYRSIKSGRLVEMTMKATDSVEQADVVDTDMQFLYADGEYWHFMNQESFEQVQADKAGMGGAEKWLKGEEACVVTLWNGNPIAVQHYTIARIDGIASSADGPVLRSGALRIPLISVVEIAAD